MHKFFKDLNTKKQVNVGFLPTYTQTHLFFFFNPYPRHFFIASPPFFKRERKGERETLMQERSIDWLPPVCTWTEDGDLGTQMGDGGSGINPET